jgi:hypothetical protein
MRRGPEERCLCAARSVAGSERVHDGGGEQKRGVCGQQAESGREKAHERRLEQQRVDKDGSAGREPAGRERQQRNRKERQAGLQIAGRDLLHRRKRQLKRVLQLQTVTNNKTREVVSLLLFFFCLKALFGDSVKVDSRARPAPRKLRGVVNKERRVQRQRRRARPPQRAVTSISVVVKSKRTTKKTQRGKTNALCRDDEQRDGGSSRVGGNGLVRDGVAQQIRRRRGREIAIGEVLGVGKHPVDGGSDKGAVNCRIPRVVNVDAVNRLARSALFLFVNYKTHNHNQCFDLEDEGSGCGGGNDGGSEHSHVVGNNAQVSERVPEHDGERGGGGEVEPAGRGGLKRKAAHGRADQESVELQHRGAGEPHGGVEGGRHEGGRRDGPAPREGGTAGEVGGARRVEQDEGRGATGHRDADKGSNGHRGSLNRQKSRSAGRRERREER